MEELAEKIAEILRRQELTEKRVQELQSTFYEELLVAWNDIQAPAAFLLFFTTFSQKYHVPIILKIIEDMEYIALQNAKYFSGLGIKAAESKGILIDLFAQMGISKDGIILKGGYFDSIRGDTSIRRDIFAYLQKQSRNKGLTSAVRKELKKIIVGNTEQIGIFEQFYTKADRIGSTIYDIYQRADRIAQTNFAEALGLEAAIYTGGLIAGSRDFCVARNGKIFLKSEIEQWVNLSFQGKPKNYNPFEDLGGYRCRHFWGWILTETALRIDTTLKRNASGKLERK